MINIFIIALNIIYIKSISVYISFSDVEIDLVNNSHFEYLM